MPRAGGVYTLPAGNPVVTLTVISSAWANTTMSDIATALTGSLPTDGTASMTGSLRLVDGAVGTPALTWATETTSGWYRIGANQFAFSVGGVLALSVNANRGWVIPTPVSGVTLALTEVTPGAASDRGFQLNGSGAGDARLGISTATAGNSQVNLDTLGVQNWVLGNTRSDGSFRISSSQALGTNDRLTISSAGNVVVAAPSSGVAFVVTGAAGGQNTAIFSSNTVANNGFGVVVTAGTNASDYALRVLSASGVTEYARLYGDGGMTLGAPTGGDQGLGTLNATGLLVNGAPVYSGMPSNAQAGNYVLVLADQGKMISESGAAATVTVPTNASVAFPVGTVISIYNNTSGNITIPTAGDTVRFGPTGVSATRTLAQNGIATLWKIASTFWVITGTGLS